MMESLFAMEVGIWFLAALAAGIIFFMYCCFNPKDTERPTRCEQLSVIAFFLTGATNAYYWLGSLFYHCF